MTARLKSELWVQALLRRCAVQGQFGAVLHKGDADAGAVLVVINHLNGLHTLLGPTPGVAYDDDGQRRFEKRNAVALPWLELQPLIERARKFDADLWVVEIEDRNGLAELNVEET